jgi:hypothetical protein
MGNDISQLAVFENFDEALRACFFTAASKDSISNHAEVEDAIRCLEIVKEPSQIVILIRSLRHLVKRPITLLVKTLKVVHRTQLMSSILKDARRISFKPGKGPLLLSSYKHMCVVHDWQTV